MYSGSSAIAAEVRVAAVSAMLDFNREQCYLRSRHLPQPCTLPMVRVHAMIGEKRRNGSTSFR